MDFHRIEDNEMKIEKFQSSSKMSDQKFSKMKCIKDVDDPPFAWKSKVFKEEFKTIIKMAFPVLITNVMQYALNVETLSFCGRLSAVEMESVGLAISIITAFGWCVCSGLVTSCDTMFAQAFGSKDKKRTGLFLQRGLMLYNLAPLFLIAIHINMEPILILLGQEHEVAKGTTEYLVAFSPGLIFMLNYIMFARFMQDQGCLWPPVFAGLCGNIFNICTQFLFVVYLGYGFRAAAICHALSYGVMFVTEFIYVMKTKFYVETWPGFQVEAFYDWFPMFKLGMAGVAHITFEVFIWEGNVLLGGIIGPLQLATQSIFLQILNTLFVIYYGSGIACNIRVGQCLGANKPNQAKAAYRAGLVSIAIAVVIIVTSVISLQYQIPHIFTNKGEIINMTIEAFPYLYLIMIFDPFSCINSAVLRGCGRQASGSLIIFVAFYVVSLPSSIILTFVFDFGLKGLWIGTTIGALITVFLTSCLLECQNWKKQAELAQQRILYSTIKCESNGLIIEDESLLHPLLVDEDFERGNIDKHIRTPSYPVSCATEIVQLPAPRIIVHKTMIFKKLLIALCIIIIFVCGIIIHNCLPVQLYRNRNSSSFIN